MLRARLSREDNDRKLETPDYHGTQMANRTTIHRREASGLVYWLEMKRQPAAEGVWDEWGIPPEQPQGTRLRLPFSRVGVRYRTARTSKMHSRHLPPVRFDD